MTVVGGLLGFCLPDVTLARISFALGGGIVAWWAGRCFVGLQRKLPAELDGAAKTRPWISRAWLLLAGLSTVLTLRIGAFMGDVERTSLSLVPGVEFMERHSCATAYVHAAVLVRDGVANPYHSSWTPEIEIKPGQPMVQHLPDDLRIEVAPMTLDGFAYPPPFLLAPRALLVITDQFHLLRTIWFGMCGLFSLWAAVAVSLHLGGRTGARAAVGLPAIWIAFPWLACLQLSNVHVALVAGAVLSMVAFANDRHVLGGGLLAFVTLAKISPGILVAYLLVRRRWSAVLWTAGWGVALLGLTFATIGTESTVAFVDYELPRIATGKAFDFLLDKGDGVITNYSVFALPFKLGGLGIGVDPWSQGPLWSWAYSLGVLALALYAASRVGLSRVAEACIWIALVGLVSLRSPAAPPYVLGAWTWMLVLMAAASRTRRGVVACGLAWLVLGLDIPIPGGGTLAYLVSLLRQFAVMGLAVWVVLRYRGGGDD